MNTPERTRIDLYLDGELTGEELRRFEARLRIDDDLRGEVELARRIEASLKARFQVKRIPFELNGAPARLGIARGPAKDPAKPGQPVNWRRIGLITALAATVLLGAALALRFSGGAPPVRPGTILERLYTKYETEGWKPAWVCEDDSEFAQAVEDRLGQPLLIDDDPRPDRLDEPELTVLGWAYGEDVSSYEVIITDKTMVLLTKVDGRGVVALVDRLDRESRTLRVPEGELTLHRREVGELVIYELTPLDGPHLLERFFVPRL